MQDTTIQICAFYRKLDSGKQEGESEKATKVEEWH